jgi:hypothetical protein
MRTRVPVALLATLCVLATIPAGSIAAPGTPPGATPNQVTDATAAAANGTDAPADPESDVVGWENGRWHNESLDVDASDGLDREESARLLNRTIARVEVLRGVEFTEPVDLNFRTRSEVAPLFTAGNVSQPAAVNAYYEALGLVGEDRDAVDVLREKQAGGAEAFVVTRPTPQLDLQAGDVTVVLDDGQSAYAETTLAHELVHTLQVQQLEFPYASAVSSADSFNARRGVVEGEASHVGYLYQRRCGTEWDCVSPESSESSGLSTAARGVLFLDVVRYSAGGEFVASLRDDGGWSAVTDAYDRLPASTEQVIHPGRYPDDTPRDVTVADSSGGDWRPVPAAADTVGESGLFTMLWYPSVASGESVVMSQRAAVNRSLRSQRPFVYGYDHPATTGWDGDRLVPYLSGSAGENETAFVWQTAWDSPEDAAEFREAYLRLLEHRGATPVEGRQDTFRIPDDRRFGDAFYINQDGETLTVVNAPTVEELSAVRNGAAPATETPTPTATATAEPTPTRTESPEPTPTATSTPNPGPTTDASGVGGSGATSTTTSGSGPGFGTGLALVALVAVAGIVAAGRRRERV